MSSEEVKTKTGATHRPYDEAFKRVAVAQWQSGVPARRVAEGLGITTESLRAWRRQLDGVDAVPTTAGDGNRVARVMQAAGLRVRARSPYRPKTTQVDHAACPSPNLLVRAAPAEAPGTHLVSDITYIPTKEGWLYLAVVLDLFSRAILGWSVAESLHASLVTDALQRAMDGGQVPAPPPARA